MALDPTGLVWNDEWGGSTPTPPTPPDHGDVLSTLAKAIPQPVRGFVGSDYFPALIQAAGILLPRPIAHTPYGSYPTGYDVGGRLQQVGQLLGGVYDVRNKRQAEEAFSKTAGLPMDQVIQQIQQNPRMLSDFPALTNMLYLRSLDEARKERERLQAEQFAEKKEERATKKAQQERLQSLLEDAASQAESTAARLGGTDPTLPPMAQTDPARAEQFRFLAKRMRMGDEKALDEYTKLVGPQAAGLQGFAPGHMVYDKATGQFKFRVPTEKELDRPYVEDAAYQWYKSRGVPDDEAKARAKAEAYGVKGAERPDQLVKMGNKIVKVDPSGKATEVYADTAAIKREPGEYGHEEVDAYGVRHFVMDYRIGGADKIHLLPGGTQYTVEYFDPIEGHSKVSDARSIEGAEGSDIVKSLPASVKAELIANVGKDVKEWTQDRIQKAMDRVRLHAFIDRVGIGTAQVVTQKTLQEVEKADALDMRIDQAQALSQRMKDVAADLKKYGWGPDSKLWNQTTQWIARSTGSTKLAEVLADAETIDSQFATVAQAAEGVTGNRLAAQLARMAMGFHIKPDEPLNVKLARIGELDKVLQQVRAINQQYRGRAFTRREELLKRMGVESGMPIEAPPAVLESGEDSPWTDEPVEVPSQ